jgi:hypothetical protein
MLQPLGCRKAFLGTKGHRRSTLPAATGGVRRDGRCGERRRDEREGLSSSLVGLAAPVIDSDSQAI